MSGYRGPLRKVVKPVCREDGRCLAVHLECGHLLTYERTRLEAPPAAACAECVGTPRKPAAPSAVDPPPSTDVTARVQEAFGPRGHGKPVAPPPPAAPPEPPGEYASHYQVLATALRRVLDDPIRGRAYAEAALAAAPKEAREHVEDLHWIAAAAVDVCRAPKGAAPLLEVFREALDLLERRCRQAGLLQGDRRGGGLGSRGGDFKGLHGPRKHGPEQEAHD